MNFLSSLSMGYWGTLMMILDYFHHSSNHIFYLCYEMYYTLCLVGTIFFYSSHENDQNSINLYIQSKISFSTRFYLEILLPYFMSLEFNCSN